MVSFKSHLSLVPIECALGAAQMSGPLSAMNTRFSVAWLAWSGSVAVDRTLCLYLPESIILQPSLIPDKVHQLLLQGLGARVSASTYT